MKQDKADRVRKGRVHDFPELQVGFPERNDVRNPDAEPADPRVLVTVRVPGPGEGGEVKRVTEAGKAVRTSSG